MGHARPREDRRGPSWTLYKFYFYGGPSACSWVCTRERPWLQACARAPIRVQAMRRGTDAWGKTPEKRVVVVPNFDNFDSAWTTTIRCQITTIQSKSAKNLHIARHRRHETRLLELSAISAYATVNFKSFTTLLMTPTTSASALARRHQLLTCVDEACTPVARIILRARSSL